MTWEPIDVATEQPYQVLIDSGVAKLLPQFLDGVDRVAVIHPPSLADKLAVVTAGLDQQITTVAAAHQGAVGGDLHRAGNGLANPREVGVALATADQLPELAQPRRQL